MRRSEGETARGRVRRPRPSRRSPSSLTLTLALALALGLTLTLTLTLALSDGREAAGGEAALLVPSVLLAFLRLAAEHGGALLPLQARELKLCSMLWRRRQRAPRTNPNPDPDPKPKPA